MKRFQLITLACMFLVHLVMAQSNTVNSPAPTSTSLSPDMKAWIESLCGYGKSLGMRKAYDNESHFWGSLPLFGTQHFSLQKDEKLAKVALFDLTYYLSVCYSGVCYFQSCTKFHLTFYPAQTMLKGR